MDAQNLLGGYALEQPAVPERHPNQRWFGYGVDSCRGFRVFRDAKADHVEVGMSMSSANGSLNAEINMGPDELRRAAAQLLSAAQDLDQYPAEVLKAQLRAAEGAKP